MRRRLLLLIVGTTALVLTALVWPLLVAYAAARSTDLHEQRLAAATRFAALPIDSSIGVATLDPELQRYSEVTSVDACAVDETRAVVAGSCAQAGRSTPTGKEITTAINNALDGSTTSPPSPMWPWDSDALVVASPVGRDAQVIGAVVLVEDTGWIREQVAWRMAIVIGASLIILGLTALLVSGPLAGWIARPVADLEERVQRLADGRPSRARIEGPPELRRLAESFNVMTAKVEHSQQQQRDLISDVSHQLANPLTALRLRLERLIDTDPAQIAPVLAETDRMSQALDSMIEVSRVGGFDRTPILLNVTARLDDRIALWRPLFGSRLVYSAPTFAAPAVLEDDLIETVVDALLDNVVKYAPDRPVEVTLAPTPDDHWTLSVRDHGDRITAAEVGQLGKRFVRLERHAQVEGTGLGLAIVAGRVADAGGRFSVVAADPGLRITVTFCRAPAAGSTPAPRDAAESAG